MINVFTNLRRGLALAVLFATGSLTAQAQSVGIGTMAPTQTLDVNGLLRVRNLSGSNVRLPVVLPDGTLDMNAPVYDTTPTTPTFSQGATGSVATDGIPVSVAVSGTTAYVVNNSPTNTLQIFDVTKSGAPIPLGSVPTNSNPQSVAVSGTTAYVVSLDSSTLQIFDVTIPSAPIPLGSVPTNSSPQSVAVSGRMAYVVSLDSSTLQIFDVTTPRAPRLLGSVRTDNSPVSVAVSGMLAYVVSIGSSTLQVVDVSTPRAPVLRGRVFTGGYMSTGPFTQTAVNTYPRSVAVNGTTAYVVNQYSSILQVFDVATPSAPALLGSLTTDYGPTSVAVNGTTAYVVNYHNTLQAFNVATPSAPVLLSTVATSNGPINVAVNGMTAYVVNDSLQTFYFPGPPRVVAMNADGSLASVVLPDATNFLQNQTAAVQIGGFNLSGNGYVGGNVGIGTNTPTEKLDVAGNIQSSGNIAVDYRSTNSGTMDNTLRFGVANSGETIGSNRTTSNNRFGLDFYTTYAKRMSITNVGNVGIGTSAPLTGLHIDRPESGSSTATGVLLSGGTAGNPSIELRGINKMPYIDFVESNGVDFTTRLYNLRRVLRVKKMRYDGGLLFQVNGNIRASNVTFNSDARFKTNVRPLTGALASVLALRGVRYTWNALGIQHGGTAHAEQVGVLAQEVEKIYPELVSTGPDGFKAVNYVQFVPVLIEAVKELSQQVQTLQTQSGALLTGSASNHSRLLHLQAQMAHLLGADAQTHR